MSKPPPFAIWVLLAPETVRSSIPAARLSRNNREGCHSGFLNEPAPHTPRATASETGCGADASPLRVSVPSALFRRAAFGTTNCHAEAQRHGVMELRRARRAQGMIACLVVNTNSSVPLRFCVHILAGSRAQPGIYGAAASEPCPGRCAAPSSTAWRRPPHTPLCFVRAMKEICVRPFPSPPKAAEAACRAQDSSSCNYRSRRCRSSGTVNL